MFVGGRGSVELRVGSYVGESLRELVGRFDCPQWALMRKLLAFWERR